jgi:hypothetical protein
MTLVDKDVDWEDETNVPPKMKINKDIDWRGSINDCSISNDLIGNRRSERFVEKWVGYASTTSTVSHMKTYE